MIEKTPYTRSADLLWEQVGEAGQQAIRTNAEANAIYHAAVRAVMPLLPFDMTRFGEQYADSHDMKDWAASIMSRRPDFLIGRDESVYMERWFVIPRNDRLNLYLHRILRDDEDVPHDHPWDSTSFIIKGGYREHVSGGVCDRREGQVIHRKATDAHRLALWHGQPCVSLFMTGPKLREWGFHCPGGWVHWKDFTDPTDHGRTARGCGEMA